MQQLSRAVVMYSCTTRARSPNKRNHLPQASRSCADAPHRRPLRAWAGLEPTRAAPCDRPIHVVESGLRGPRTHPRTHAIAHARRP